jgi:hypothetical protein
MGWVLHYNPPPSRVPGWRCCLKVDIQAVKAAGPGENITAGVMPAYLPLPPYTADGVVHPPMGPRGSPNETYLYDNSSNQWRLLRVRNATDDFTYVELDEAYVFQPPQFREFYDNKADPWQQHNLWPSLGSEKQAALASMLATLGQCEGAGCP